MDIWTNSERKRLKQNSSVSDLLQERDLELICTDWAICTYEKRLVAGSPGTGGCGMFKQRETETICHTESDAP